MPRMSITRVVVQSCEFKLNEIIVQCSSQSTCYCKLHRLLLQHFLFLSTTYYDKKIMEEEKKTFFFSFLLLNGGLQTFHS